MKGKLMVIADAGFVVGAAVATDQYHKACTEIFEQHDKIYLPQSTLAEVGYYLQKLSGNMGAAYFLEHLAASKYEVVALTDEDFIRTAELLRIYADTRVDFVDASIAAVAERLNVKQILTVDKRDFYIIRPKHVDYFELLP